MEKTMSKWLETHKEYPYDSNESWHAYDDMLDDCYPDVLIFQWKLEASRVFKEIDPIAYNVNYDSWYDSLDGEEWSYEDYEEWLCNDDDEIEDEKDY